jgi:AbrB family looped-hinge helix DNA binding protein
MRTTIDSAGRVVIPKPVRDQAGLEAGTEVEVEFRDGQIVLEPTTVSMRVVKRAPGAIIEAEGEMPTLTSADVRAVLERVRR